MGQGDVCHQDASLLERVLAIHRGHRQRRPAKERPHYCPEERAEILQVMRLRGWSAKVAGQRFVVYPNTIRNWQKAVEDRREGSGCCAPRRETGSTTRGVARGRDAVGLPRARVRDAPPGTSCGPGSGSAGPRSPGSSKKKRSARTGTSSCSNA